MAEIEEKRKKTSRELGLEGEEFAQKFFTEQGYTVVAKNVRGPVGEIDLIVQFQDELVFVEVKSWSTWGEENLAGVIGKRKQRKIIETAKFFLAQHREYSNMAYRFDVLLFGPKGIHHLAHAFMERV